MAKFTKRIISIIFIFVLIQNTLNAQSPNSFNYQAVARDNTGNILTGRPISLRISILENSINGNAIYTETHSTTSNQSGIINLIIGNGNVFSGNFASINWGVKSFFIKLEMDVNAGSNYSLIGTSQLLSVPYSLYANKSAISEETNSLPQYSQSQIEAINPKAGTLCFNTDYKAFQYYDGSQWISLQKGGCVPKANTATTPTYLASFDQNLTLQGNQPAVGIKGKWTIIKGTGGSFDDNTSYNATFKGTLDSMYTLRWSLMGKCDTTYADSYVFLGSKKVSFGGKTLQISPSDNGYCPWGNVSVLTSATSTTDGSKNTSIIVNALGNNNSTTYAAKICDTLTMGGYTDWYLPSKDELNAIFPEMIKVSNNTSLNSYYWSSTEYDISKAWSEISNTPNYQIAKTTIMRVRCVRSL